jgi:hypothetical protein
MQSRPQKSMRWKRLWANIMINPAVRICGWSDGGTTDPSTTLGNHVRTCGTRLKWYALSSACRGRKDDRVHAPIGESALGARLCNCIVIAEANLLLWNPVPRLSENSGADPLSVPTHDGSADKLISISFSSPHLSLSLFL